MARGFHIWDAKETGMKKVLVITAIAVVAVSLSGCAPRIAGASGGSITFSNATHFNMGKQYRLAEDHCNKFGKTAEEVPDSRPDGMHTFKCVAK